LNLKVKSQPNLSPVQSPNLNEIWGSHGNEDVDVVFWVVMLWKSEDH
jgi:hypothetical protein